MSRPHRKPATSAKHRQPTTSDKKALQIASTGAGFQRADHVGSGGRCAVARAGSPLSAVPVEAQYIVRAGVLAFTLGVGAAVVTTPGVAFAEPTDTSSSSSSSGSSSSASSSSSESAASTSSTDPTSSTTSSASAAGASPGSTSEKVQSSVDSRTSSTSSARHASTAHPRSGVVQSSGGAHTGSIPSSSETTTAASPPMRSGREGRWEPPAPGGSKAIAS